MFMLQLPMAMTLQHKALCLTASQAIHICYEAAVTAAAAAAFIIGIISRVTAAAAPLPGVPASSSQGAGGSQVVSIPDNLLLLLLSLRWLMCKQKPP
jgi:hypothetical protein